MGGNGIDDLFEMWEGFAQEAAGAKGLSFQGHHFGLEACSSRNSGARDYYTRTDHCRAELLIINLTPIIHGSEVV